MTIEDALIDIAAWLARYDRTQSATGLPALRDADLSWGGRQFELDARVNLIARQAAADGHPTMEALDALGAHVIEIGRASCRERVSCCV